MASIQSETRKLAHSDFPHLSREEWGALQRMADNVGADTVGAMLTTLDQSAQRASILTFMQRETAERQQRVASEQQHLVEQFQQQVAELHQRISLLTDRQQPPQVVTEREPRVDSLKVDVSKYRGSENESLLRWLVELDAAMIARRIRDPLMQVTFAMSNLAGRAKTWAFGRRLANSSCFSTYEEFKMELRHAFEPPKTEFRARSEFLRLAQGKRDIHAYSQHARYLVSCVVSNPIDEQTQVVTFITGLNDGPIKTYLFREYPETMEEAIALAIQEDFSLNQARVHSASYRPPKARTPSAFDSAEPMDLSVIESVKPRTQSSKRQQRCNRCQRLGHFAYECMAPKPVSRSNAGPEHRQRFEGKPRSERLADKPKNGKSQ